MYSHKYAEQECTALQFSVLFVVLKTACLYFVLEEGIALCGGPKMKPGYIQNRITNQTEEIDECHLMPTMCNHGRCMNIPGSFECQCDRGFIYDISVHQCIGMTHIFINLEYV
jgi:hypothetical protein